MSSYILMLFGSSAVCVGQHKNKYQNPTCQHQSRTSLVLFLILGAQPFPLHASSACINYTAKLKNPTKDSEMALPK